MKITGKINILALWAMVGLWPNNVAAEQSAPPIDSYAEVSRLWMGMEEGSIRPAAYEQVRATSSGYLQIHIKDGAILKKGHHWATQDPEQMQLEIRSLELDQIKLDRSLKDTQRSREESNIRLRIELHEIERQKQDLLAASENLELPQALRQRASEAAEKADQQIISLSEKLDPEEIEKEIDIERQDGELQIERKKKQLDVLKKNSEMVAKFGGELNLDEEIKKRLAEQSDPNQPIWVESNELIATILDDSRYEISVIASSPLLAQIPREELLVFVQEGQTGKLIAGDYERTDEIDTGSEITRNYIFAIQENSLADARNSMGQKDLVHVYRKFDRKYRIIHKKDVAFFAPEVLESAGWAGLVRHLWPGSEVIQVGPQTIAIKPKDDN